MSEERMTRGGEVEGRGRKKKDGEGEGRRNFGTVFTICQMLCVYLRQN